MKHQYLRVVIILLIDCLFIPLYCEGGDKCNLIEARAAVKVLKAIGEQNPTIALYEFVLQQPTLTGVVGEEGGFIHFDEQFNPIWGITTRVYDNKTGQEIPNRWLTKKELTQAIPFLKGYFREYNKDAIVKNVDLIYSNSFKDAICKSLLNKDMTRPYTISGKEKVLSIYRIDNGKKRLIAAEGILSIPKADKHVYEKAKKMLGLFYKADNQ